MGASVVPCSDASPILDTPEHALDFVALFVEFVVVFDFGLAVCAPGNAGLDLE